MQDVAELMGDHALKLVAAQLVDAAARHADGRIARPVASGERR